jgi:hypothetical protein
MIRGTGKGKWGQTHGGNARYVFDSHRGRAGGLTSFSLSHFPFPELPPGREHNDPSPWNLASAFGSEAVLFDELVLEPADVGGLR